MDFVERVVNAEISGNKKSYLRIVEQPQNKFRFRYKSELGVTHGCLLAKNSTSKSRIHPTVELLNCNKRVLIRCRLVQHHNSDEHPHRLQEDAEEDVSREVPERGSYRASFGGMTIVHTAKKDVPAALYKMYKKNDNVNPDTDHKQLRHDCSKKAPDINLNIVRLRFSVHDIETGQEICEPVFSEPIHNRKSVATNSLKICRMSRFGGHPAGDDEIFMFVEKVKKDDIQVHFIEYNEAGKQVWFAKANFSKNDVHHQYAIVFRTPPHGGDQDIEAKVSVVLFRPSDQSYSEPMEFSYYSVPFAEQSKRKTPCSPCLPSTSSDSQLSEGSGVSTDGYTSSAMDAQETVQPQMNEQGDTASEPHQSSGYFDLDNINADIPCLLNADIDQYLYQILTGSLETDSGSGTVKKLDALALCEPDVMPEPEDDEEDQSAGERENTCQYVADSGVLGDVPEKTLLEETTVFKTNVCQKLYRYFDFFLPFLFLCLSIVVAVYL